MKSFLSQPFKTILFLNDTDSIIVNAGDTARGEAIIQWLQLAMNTGAAFSRLPTAQITPERYEQLGNEWQEFLKESSPSTVAKPAASSKLTPISSKTKRSVGGTSRKPTKRSGR